jgi:transcription termination factor NusB
VSRTTAKEEALKEVEKERFNADKEEYKTKLVQLARAEKVVANIKREIEDLDAKISEA